ncbi:NAD-dependent epimerase/dehydratase family protein [Aquimarina algicola]|uniref:NAD-dependent epimerase/dehydratase family protein n=1 Tax=Aquimarina algicola TaxID=2589995 RepID=A0A504JGI5_9FLAO|nr:NAD-dependent epimerase/dehydratase family protein [Aquimarina algicola]TPN87535.1 NAD-dependent epimerase/dehydratase family protein [Aquimarina algicola]
MVLVTGATGLVGTHMLIKLIKEQSQIRALYRTEAKKEKAKTVFLSYFSKKEEYLFDTIDWVKADINDIPALSEAFKGITHVYHCAAIISFDISQYKKLRKVNIEGTANIVNLSLVHNVQKLCHVSSIATLGDSINGQLIDENAEWNPEVKNSVYAITKYGAEMEVWRGTQEGLNAIIVNPGVIIGPGFFYDGSGYIFKKIYNGMPYYTNGVTGYVGIEDVVNLMFLLTNSEFTRERYIVVSENLSFQKAFEMIAKHLQKPIPKKEITPFLMKGAYYMQRFGRVLFNTKQVIFKPSIKSAFSKSIYKNDKIIQALDYNFIPIENTIKKTAKFFLENR